MKLLRHIDNGYYRLTARQAASLCGGKLPAWNCEKRIDLPLPVDYFIAMPGVCAWMPIKPVNAKYAYVLRTPCGYHDRRIVKEGWVWAIRIHESAV